METVVCPNCGEENPAKFRLCGYCGTPLAQTLPPQELRKTVTILFSDLKGSTALGESVDPEALHEIKNRYFEAMSQVLERHGGSIEKYIGDAVMAVFGIPTMHEDDALRAVRAAGEMGDRLALLNEELERDAGVVLAARTGVNTGEVVVGDGRLGGASVTGRAVNIAKRLEQAAHRGDVGKLRHIVDDDRLVGQQGGGEDRQRRVLGAADRDAALQRSSASNPYLIHRS